MYQSREDAWGLDVWGGAVPPGLVAASLALYDEFYGLLDELVAAAIADAGVAVVLDCHSYNHRRAGPDAPAEPHEDNPEINVGTGTVDHARWGGAVEAFNAALRAQDLDVRENVRFRGGHVSRHVNSGRPRPRPGAGVQEDLDGRVDRRARRGAPGTSGRRAGGRGRAVARGGAAVTTLVVDPPGWEGVVEDVVARLARDAGVRRRLPDGGIVSIDRQLPFLVVHRADPRRPDPATRRLVEGEAALLVAPPGRAHRAAVRRLVKAVAEQAAETFGAALVLELWSPPPPADGEPVRLAFDVRVDRQRLGTPSLQRLERALRSIRVGGGRATVEVSTDRRLAPPGFSPLLTPREQQRAGVTLACLCIAPVHKGPDGEYPFVARALKRQLGRATKQYFYEFAVRETSHHPGHYQALGKRALVKAVWTIDRELAAISAQFDTLLLVTPLDTPGLWRTFQARRYAAPPQFRYRPISVDPDLLKRRLYQIPIERVEDPTLERLFQDKQHELDLKLSLVAARGTPRFLPLSQATYGIVRLDLRALARDVLVVLNRKRRGSEGAVVPAAAFAQRAEQELAAYRRLAPDLGGSVVISPDVASLVVSGATVYVGSGMSFSERRVDALLHHEVGTHVVTWYNGQSQRLTLMRTGLPGYDEVQEGLAVLAEWMVGGLTAGRLRLLAARVLACAALSDGAEFLDTYRLIRSEAQVSAQMAFYATVRVYRGGGFVKDAAYLRGLTAVFDYLRGGGDLRTLLTGKIALEHVGLIQELQRRRILKPPALLPRWLEAPSNPLERAVEDRMTVLAIAEGARA